MKNIQEGRKTRDFMEQCPVVLWSSGFYFIKKQDKNYLQSTNNVMTAETKISVMFPC